MSPETPYWRTHHSQQAASLDEPRAVEHRWSRLIDHRLIDGSMGQVFYILFSISLTEQEEAAARAVCLDSHAARGDYSDCDSASVGSHAARGGRGLCSSARALCGGGCGSTHTMCAQREVLLAPRNND